MAALAMWWRCVAVAAPALLLSPPLLAALAGRAAAAPAAKPAFEGRVLQEIHAVLLERRLEERLESSLKLELNIPDAFARVRVRVEERQAGQAGPERAAEPEGGSLLPGVPANRGLPKPEDDPRKVQAQTQTVLLRDVTVLLAAATPKARVADVRAQAQKVLGLDVERGDTLLVDFRPGGGPETQKELKAVLEDRWSRKLGLTLLASIAGLLLLMAVAAVFAFWTLKGTLQQAVEGLGRLPRAGAAAQAGGGGGGGGGGTVTAKVDLSGASLSVSQSQEIKYFGFVNADNLPQFQAALEAEERPELMAAALQCLPGRMAASAFGGLPMEKQVAVLVVMQERRTADARELREAEAAVRDRMGLSYGGMDMAGGLLQRLEERSRAAVLQLLQDVDPDYASALAERIFDFREVALYDQRSLQKIYRELGPQRFSTLLEPLAEAERAAFYRLLSPEVATLLRERLQVMPQVSKDDWNDEAAKALQAIKALGAKGAVPSFEKLSRRRNPGVKL